MSLASVTIEYFACWSCSPICNPREGITEREAAVISATRCFGVGISSIIRQEAAWPAGAWLQPLELLHRWPRALTLRWSEIITEGNPLALGPGNRGEGVGTLWRAGRGRVFDGVNWLSWLGDGGTLGSCRYGLKCLERVFRWIPWRGCRWRERGNIFGLLALCQGRRLLPLWRSLSWRRQRDWQRR